MAAFARRLCCVLHDLGERPLAALSGDAAVWSGLAALVAAFRGQPEAGVLRRILSGLPDGSELELQVLSYIVSTYELTPAMLETAARAAKPERWEALMSTVAEAWVREGEAKGEARGRVEGKVEGKAEARSKRCFVFCSGDSVLYRRVLGRGLWSGRRRRSMSGSMPC